MGDFDWRPLIYMLTLAAFTLLWLVGCTILTDSGTRSAPTAYPQVTLTVGRLTESVVPTNTPPPRTAAQPTPTIPPSGDSPLSPPQLSDQLAPALQNVRLIPPTCYETLAGGTRCLGRLDNPLDTPISSASVQVRLYQQDGESITQMTAIEQAVIPPGSFAPYRVDFTARWDRYGGVTAALLTGSVDTPLYIALPVDVVRLNSGTGSVRTVTGIVQLDERVPLSRIVATLTDLNGRVVGYQVIRYDPEATPTTRTIPVRAVILSQTAPSELSAFIHAEARKN